MKDNGLKLTKESLYRVQSVGSRDEIIESTGRFKGVVSVGTSDGLVLELDASHGDLEGKQRVIPSHMVLTIDILDAAEGEEEKREETHIHYS